MRLRAFRFLADENIHPDVIAFLNDSGLDVASVGDLGLAGKGDSVILTRALAEQRLVLTHDSDFGALAVAGGQRVWGIVYLRPGHVQAEFTIKTLTALIESELDVAPPFIVAAVRKGSAVRVRLRRLGIGQ